MKMILILPLFFALGADQTEHLHLELGAGNANVYEEVGLDVNPEKRYEILKKTFIDLVERVVKKEGKTLNFLLTDIDTTSLQEAHLFLTMFAIKKYRPLFKKIKISSSLESWDNIDQRSEIFDTIHLKNPPPCYIEKGLPDGNWDKVLQKIANKAKNGLLLTYNYEQLQLESYLPLTLKFSRVQLSFDTSYFLPSGTSLVGDKGTSMVFIHRDGQEALSLELIVR